MFEYITYCNCMISKTTLTVKIKIIMRYITNSRNDDFFNEMYIKIYKNRI